MRKPDLSCDVTESIYPGLGLHIPSHARRAWKIEEPPSAFGWSRPPLNRQPMVRWLLSYPHLHPAWDHWLVSLIHLRPIDGLPPAEKSDPSHEYELAVFAVDPSCKPDPTDVSSIWLLSPPCVVKQFGGTTDRNAINVAEACVLACVGGGLAPDDDFRDAWNTAVDAELMRLKRGR